MTDAERYALIGTGSRAELYLDGILARPELARLVAWSDPNPGRQDYYEAKFPPGRAPHRFDPAELETAIAEHGVQRVIVTTPDFTHAEYVSRALLAGADVVVEKPLTIDVDGVRRIRHALDESGRSLVTTFNYRYSPRNSALKRVIASGRIGQVTSVHFEWVLDTAHGADYFRRWHRYKKNNGGLLVHKASHHFDLVNWWIDAAPVRVFASGGLRFYGAENAARRGLGPRPERGTGHAAEDPWSLDLTLDAKNKGLYFDAEKYDGYLRDRDVFDPGITIEDNLSLVVDYDTGASMSYSLNAHSPWEGYRIAVNGTEGRAELDVVERGAVLRGPDGFVVVDPSAQPGLFPAADVRPPSERLLVQRHWEPAEEVPIEAGTGGHGGGDALMLDHVFGRVSSDEPLHRIAGVDDGVRAVSVGIAGNRSLETGAPVVVSELGLDAAQ
ncbi:Gfo/Idh/MocA family protein [Gryllotalpicola ginsengisoli]|uniref:Gfo/Idh/MocA family protein n=1 Tax=Gryllotalpicola ginsengisoli TaxID=444608 RepID=UPI0003F5440B|nr:Gfo/Idh/MocA family oxidoreductase [Gryllotalpicola ginsengisoli]